MSQQLLPRKPRCRFDLFVRIRPGVSSSFNDQKRTFCYRGDKYTDVESKMIRNLLNLVTNRISEYDILVLYDNNFSQAQENRTVLKITDGRILVNRLDQYQDLLTDYPLPDFLK